MKSNIQNQRKIRQARAGAAALPYTEFSYTGKTASNAFRHQANQRHERSGVFGGGRQRIRREATVFDTQQETWQPREGRCALPYAELVNTANIKSQKPANQREEGWNGRASRRTQIDKAIQENKTSAGIGTTVEHPPRERIVIKRTRYRRLTQRPSPTQKVLNNETG